MGVRKNNWLNRRLSGGSLIALLGASVAGCATGLGGCAGKPAPTTSRAHPLSFAISSLPSKTTTIGVKKASGWVSELLVSKDGKVALLSTIPDRDKRTGRYAIAAWTIADRKPLWEIPLSSSVKSQAISADGKFAVYQTYDEKFHAIDADGKELWAGEGECKPTILNSSKKLLCYHDDDAAANVAFDVYDWKGEKLSSFPLDGSLRGDVLNLKISADERNVVLALTGGLVAAVGPDFKLLWKAKTKGEIVDAAISDGEHPIVALITHLQKLELYQAKGKLVARADLRTRGEQLEIAPDGKGVAIYENSQTGQELSYFSVPKLGNSTQVLSESWRRSEDHHGEYAPQMSFEKDQIVFGLEDISEKSRHFHVIGFDRQGGLKWNIPIRDEQNLYLHSQAFDSGGSGVVAVATDDGEVSFYKVTAPPGALK